MRTHPAVAGFDRGARDYEKGRPVEQVLDRQQLVARALSVSFIAQLPAAEQEQVAREVGDLAGAQDKLVVLHHVTEAYWCEAVDGRLPG